MAYTDTFPDDVLDTVATQIGSRLSLPSGERAVEIRETFSVWMLGLDATTKPEEPIAKLVTKTGRWHHQISIGSQVRSFARSTPYGPTAADWSITQVTSDSPIAEAIDEAIDWVDKNVKDDPLVRLVVIPSYYLHVFWLETEKGSHILVVHKPDQYIRLKYETIYSLREFLELLAQEPHALGIPLSPPEKTF
ncbi:hypothetical protein A6S26_32360 [Nostoc sp. ATCC 43529]|nr:hypothetical protein A6S26_32360 [Nostoc sp. ATCC 43529]